MRIVWFLTLLLATGAVATAQNQPDSACPAISLDGPGPMGVPQPGEVFYYSLKVGEVAGGTNLKYEWKVVGGTVVSGQGTTRAAIGFDGLSGTVSVIVKGLPPQCPETAAETFTIDLAPTADNLGQFKWPMDTAGQAVLKETADRIQGSPNSQLYIFVPPDFQISEAIAEAIYNATPKRNVDRSRITFVETSGKNPLIQVWLVPPGASPPKQCDECEVVPTKRDCPTITIEGPARITLPGDAMSFRVTSSQTLPEKTKFIWQVFGGAVESGQGTATVTVRTTREDAGMNIKAVVSVFGIPNGCDGTAEEMAGVAPIYEGDPVDTYGKVSLYAEYERMQNGVAQAERSPGFMLVIVKRSPRFTSVERNRVRALEKFIVGSLHFPRSRFKIITTPGAVETIIWLVPPGARMPK